jgi:DNA polymerase IV
LKSATNDVNGIYKAALENLEFFEKKDEVRLIGVQLSSILKNNVVQLSFDDLK